MAVKLNRKGVGLSGANLDKENENLALIEQEFREVGQAVPKANEALAKATAAEAKTDNVQKQLGTLVVQGDSSPQAAQASVGADGTEYNGNLKARLDAEQLKVVKQLTDTQSAVGGDPSQIWYPPAQPKTDDILWAGNRSYADHLALWEGLRTKSPDYIKRELLGKDTSGVHDIWKYIFAPLNYEKTVILSANVHGAEKEGQKILYRFMWHLCNDYNKYSQLNYARNKVRFIVIPIANPAGLEAGTRGNSRGVDINRNFNYNWAAYNGAVGSIEYKGTAPLSEKETQYIDQVLRQYANEGAVSSIDIHSTAERNANLNSAHYYAETSRYGTGAKNIINQVINAVTPKGYQIAKKVFETINPNVYNQADHLYGLHAVTPEWEPGAIYGVTRYSSEEMTHAVRFIGNIILQFAALNPRKYELPDPWVIEHSMNSLDWRTNATPGTYEEIPNIGHTFSPNVDGILYVAAEMQFINTTSAANNFFYILVDQTGNPVLTSTAPAVLQSGSMELVKQTDGRADTFSMTRMVPIFAKDDYKADVSIKLMVRTDVGQILARRVRLHAMFVPTKGNPNYTNRGSDGGNPQNRYYPQNIIIN